MVLSMYQTIIDKIKPELDKIIEYLRQELVSLQIGRAKPSLIEDILVEAYGQKIKLKDLANIQVPDPSQLIIRPWDKSIIKNIEWAVRQSRLKLSPAVEEDFIRIKVPALSEERRNELVKIVNEKAEECRISVRRQRGEAWDQVQTMEQNSEITEDDKFKAKDKLQELVDHYNQKIDEISEQKKKEIIKL